MKTQTNLLFHIRALRALAIILLLAAAMLGAGKLAAEAVGVTLPLNSKATAVHVEFPVGTTGGTGRMASLVAAPLNRVGDSGQLLVNSLGQVRIGTVAVELAGRDSAVGRVAGDFTVLGPGPWAVWSELDESTRTRGFVVDVDEAGRATPRRAAIEDAREGKDHDCCCDDWWDDCCDCCDDWWDDCCCGDCWDDCCCDCCGDVTVGEVVAVAAVLTVAAAVSECSITEPAGGVWGFPFAAIGLLAIAAIRRRRLATVRTTHAQ